MTDHPLTDEMCENIAPMAQWVGDIGDTIFRHCDMRAAYDKGAADKLEQVVKWLKATKSTVKLCPSVLAVQLEQAMRPQQQEDS